MQEKIHYIRAEIKTGLFPLLPKQGIIAAYVKKALKESKLDLPLSFILNFHYKRLKYKIKSKL